MIEVNPSTSIAGSSPFTIDMGLILICHEGRIDVGLDMQSYHLRANDVMIMLPGQIVEQQIASPDFRGTLMIYSTSFFSNINFPVNFPLVIYDIQSPLLHLNDEYYSIIDKYRQTIESLCDADIRLSLKNESFKYICMSLMFAFKEQIHLYTDHDYDQNKVVSKRFLRILAANFKDHRELQFYADELHLSKKYFSVLIKNETGKTASDWIDEFIVLEAKKLLATTDKTIQDVSNAMNFSNQSFFGKFFKRMTGMSPKGYRKSLQEI